MHLSSAVRRWLILLSTLLAVFACTAEANAGTLQIRDEEHVLAATDAARLRSVVASVPFDARLLFTSETADAHELSRVVGGLVNEPNLMVIGVDPTHRHVAVHFGTGAGIARSEWPAIEQAGNSAFRNGNWEAGAEAIVRMAAQATTTSGPNPIGSAAPHSSFFGSGLVLLLVFGGLIAATSLWARRRAMYGDGYGQPPYGGGPMYGGPTYGGPPQGGGLGPVGGGLIGAGLGGLAGYELGKMEGEREERDRDQAWDRAQPSDDNFDAGGGDSSWGDGGADGGFDGGGSDGGGGSDF